MSSLLNSHGGSLLDHDYNYNDGVEVDEVEFDKEPIRLNNLNDLDSLPSAKLRARLNSVSSQSSTASTVTIRQGHVYNNKQKSKIPEHHKVIMLCFIIVLIIGVPWLIYGISRDEITGMFQIGEEEVDSDFMQHEKKVGWDGRDIAGFIVASILIMVAAGGGIGGGGVLVPTYIFVLNFEPKYAIPLSNCTILGSSLSNLLLNFNKRHPDADRPLIDWDIMLMMEPLTIAGALIGTFVNVLCPPWLITVMLVVLLVATAHRTLGKGIKKFKQESILLAQQEENEAIKLDKRGNQYQSLPGQENETQTQKMANGQNVDGTILAWTTEEVKTWWERSLPPGAQEYIHLVDDCELDGTDLLDLDYESLKQFDVKKLCITKILKRIGELKSSLGIIEDTDKEDAGSMRGGSVAKDGEDPRMVSALANGNTSLAEILEKERWHTPWKVVVMFVTTIGMLTLTLLKGGGSINLLNIECGEALYWTLTLAALPFVLTICFFARRFLIQRFYEKKECNYEYLPHDVVWNEEHTIRYPLICSIAGLCAGMFGIGGGIVKGPLMLEMNVLPQVTSATSATMILFTSSGACVSYLVFEQLNLHYGKVVFCLGIVFTLIGQLSLNKVVAYYKRNSLIILVIGVTVALSAVAMGIESSGALIDLFKGEAAGGGDICGAGGE